MMMYMRERSLRCPIKSKTSGRTSYDRPIGYDREIFIEICGRLIIGQDHAYRAGVPGMGPGPQGSACKSAAVISMRHNLVRDFWQNEPKVTFKRSTTASGLVLPDHPQSRS